MGISFRLARGGKRRLKALEHLLASAYSIPESVLGNKKDPLDEAVYIILTFQTDLPRAVSTWRALRRAFPHWRDMERAPLAEIAEVLRSGGLHQQKARSIRRLLRETRRIAGELSLDFLHSMPSAAAERMLVRLPGLSWKGAKCVLLYSLRRDVFPVDGNTFRVFSRTGIVPLNSVYRRRALHEGLEAAVPAATRRRFHVNLVVHGQETCLPRNPRCSECCARSICERRNIMSPSRSRV